MGFGSQVGFHLQDASNELFGGCRDGPFVSVAIFAIHDESTEFCFVAGSEREHSHQHKIKHYSQCPYISLISIVGHFSNQFRAHKSRCATVIAENCFGRGTKAEIDQLDISLIIYEDVLRLEIPMTDAFGVNVGNPLQNLPEITTSMDL